MKEFLHKIFGYLYKGSKGAAKSLFIFVIGMLLFLAIVEAISKWNISSDYNGEVMRSRNELHYYGLKDQLVDATDNYIQKVGKGSCLNAITLIEACEEYNIDLKFALAQGHIESHFGTKGVAAKTNSVFNVMSFDGLSAEQIIRSGKGYSHPDHSVVPYMKLLNEKYLVDKTEEDLFINFVNANGDRYASNKNYEKQLLDIYNKIDSISPGLSTIYQDFKKYKIILNR